MNELAYIESIYGSVAEYQRVMQEESQEVSETTEEELLKTRIDQEVYHKKIELLNGEPSSVIKFKKIEYDEKKPVQQGSSYSASDYYANVDWSNECLADVLVLLVTLYNVSVSDDSDVFYKTPVETFAISVEYQKHSQIFHKMIGSLNYNTFKDVFRALHYLGFHPTMLYRETEDHSVILSNCSLGELRIYDLKMLGLETEQSISEELKSLGFNEEDFRKALL